MKLLLLLLVLVAIVEANIYIKDVDHAAAPFDKDTDVQIDEGTRSPTDDASPGTLQDAPVRDGSDQGGPGLDEDFFGEEKTPMRAMRMYSAFNFKDDSRDISNTANVNTDQGGNEVMRRPFVDSDAGPLRAFRTSDSDVNDDAQELDEVKSEDHGLEGIYPYDDYFGKDKDKDKDKDKARQGGGSRFFKQ